MASAVAIFLLDCPYWDDNRMTELYVMGVSLFFFGLFSTFTLVPIYKVLINSIDSYFDMKEYSKSDIIDKVSALIVFLKSIA